MNVSHDGQSLSRASTTPAGKKYLSFVKAAKEFVLDLSSDRGLQWPKHLLVKPVYSQKQECIVGNQRRKLSILPESHGPMRLLATDSRPSHYRVAASARTSGCCSSSVRFELLDYAPHSFSCVKSASILPPLIRTATWVAFSTLQCDVAPEKSTRNIAHSC